MKRKNPFLSRLTAIWESYNKGFCSNYDAIEQTINLAAQGSGSTTATAETLTPEQRDDVFCILVEEGKKTPLSRAIIRRERALAPHGYGYGLTPQEVLDDLRVCTPTALVCTLTDKQFHAMRSNIVDLLIDIDHSTLSTREQDILALIALTCGNKDAWGNLSLATREKTGFVLEQIPPDIAPRPMDDLYYY